MSESGFHITPEEIAEIRSGDSYGDRGYLNGCWYGYRAASASRSEILEALEELDSAQASANTTSECIDIAAHYEAMDRLNAAWKSARALLAKYQGE